MSNPYAATSASAYGSQTPNPNNPNNATAGFGSGSAFSSGAMQDGDRRVKYRCADCDTEVHIGRGDPIRCVACGHRVLYKLRTTKMVQFEAR